jgi:ribose 5-phosphate isomerase B
VVGEKQSIVIYLVADHGGFRAKERLKRALGRQRRRVEDLGPARLDPSDDYPPAAARLALAVHRSAQHRGIALCRSGVGMAVVANKFPGIRAVTAVDPWSARRARQDEDANVLALAADRLTDDAILRISQAFLTTRFAAIPRYRRRLRQIRKIERAFRR